MIRPGGAGDAILLTPAIRMLKDKIKDAKIHFLGEKRNIDFAEFCYGELIEKFIIYDSPSFLYFVLRNLGKYNLVIDTEQFFSLPALFGKILGNFVVGFSTKKYILDFSVDYFHFSFEAFEFFRLFASAVKIMNEEKLSDIKIDDLFQSYMNFSGKVRKTEHNFDIVFAPYTTKIEKHYWGINQVIDSLSKKYRTFVIGDKKLGIDDIFSIVDSARVVVGVDNAIVHIAALLGKPSFVIFGPTNHIKWSYSKTTKIIRTNTWCSPCSYFAEIPKCPRNVECMREISPSEIISRIESFLAEV
ncbi:MAG: glycosyltransferase family 9 protein [Candidatus Calescibacterium sp.]|nr:glycosyltransferase family 9 protein [Candidatus Calescibacterium sp.]